MLVHKSAGSTDSLTATTAAINTTGATVIVVVAGGGSGLTFTAGQITDSAGNTWSLDTVTNATGTVVMGIWSTITPITSATHTFTFSGATAIAPFIAVIAADGTAARDKINNNFNSGAATTLQTGSVTPASAGELIVAGFVADDSTDSTVSIDSGFTVVETVPLAGGLHYMGAIAYLIQGAAAAVNPTWTLVTASHSAAVIETFTAAAGVTLMGAACL